MLFEAIRSLIIPFAAIEKHVPKKGKVLDVGCGHGTFVRLLAKTSNHCQVLGIDPSSRKITYAKTHNTYSNLQFRKAYLNEISGKFSCITIIDVLYLLPWKEKVRLLHSAYHHLNQNGILLLVVNGRGESPVFKLLNIQEMMMTRILKLTYTDHQGIYFENEEEVKRLLQETKFKVNKILRLSSFLPYPHLLFIANKI